MMAMQSAADLNELIASARRQHRAGAGTVLDVLLRSAGRDEAALLRRLRDEAGVEAASPAEAEADFASLDLKTAAAWRCVVLRRTGRSGLWLGMEDPWNDELLRRAERHVRASLEPVALTSADLSGWLEMSGERQAGTHNASTTPAIDAAHADGPIVAFVDTAVKSAFEAGASDIHFECDRKGVTVKLRQDGVMARFARLEGTQPAQEVISRIKVLAQLDITERRVPQDGRFRFALPGHGEGGIDLRVSIMPSVFGEDAVLRLLDKAQLRASESPVSLDLLGFDTEGAQLIRDLANEPSGMLLVTGPTGSGKTTTVYAALTEINTGLEKIITIEDPVEYELPGVLQIPVNERKGLTFAKGLRSILRHDPDRILVGEIRDAETAEIAVQSALTGHLVFTTVHANSMADIMGRFRHFGLDMFGFMSSLNGVVVQRLMRRACPHCVGRREATAPERDWLARAGQGGLGLVPRAMGCEHCHGSGYRGRFVVAEVHVIDDVLRDHVTEGSPVSVLKRHAQERGVASLAQQAALRVASAQTTLEEVKRVVGWL
jgi:general secretion pathway protein E